MSDKFDPATHRFGMAYIDRDKYLVYPTEDKIRLIDHVPCLWNNKFSYCKIENLTRAPEHDLIPRPQSSVTVEQARAALDDLLEDEFDILSCNVPLFPLKETYDVLVALLKERAGL